MALASGTSQLFGNFFASLYTLYALDTLGLSPLLLGIVISAGGVGSLAPRTGSRRVGHHG